MISCSRLVNSLHGSGITTIFVPGVDVSCLEPLGFRGNSFGTCRGITPKNKCLNSLLVGFDGDSGRRQKILTCWSSGGRFWYLETDRGSGTLCVPELCSAGDVETAVAQSFLARVATTDHKASSELAPLFAFLLFWASLCFPLTRQKNIFFCWGPNSSQEGGEPKGGHSVWLREPSAASMGFKRIQKTNLTRGSGTPKHPQAVLRMSFFGL